MLASRPGMFLRALTLRGFKSFAEKVTLEFTPGISVIVGPNGSGKSNLVDAISWVLGEQGPRALRGSQMADVIFAGSPTRPPLGMADVRLVIDNSSGLIPVPLTEIEISRTVFRSGQSEYRIGGKLCRLLDVQELLAEGGIGRALHTVVGQGQLEDVLTARPEERRQYVEEAAGIAKHRRRRERAERKLSSLDQDLKRLQDVLGELRRQLKPLKQQAEVARRYEELSREAEELAWRLAAARLRALTAEHEARRAGWEEGLARRREARERLEALDRGIEGLQREREEAARALREAEAALEEAEGERRAAEAAFREAVHREAEARARAKDGPRPSRLAALDEEIRRVQAALSETVAALAERERALAAAERGFQEGLRVRREAEEERRRLAEEAAAHRAEVEAIRRSLDSSARERRRLLAALADVRGRLAAVRSRYAQVAGEDPPAASVDGAEGTPSASDLASLEEALAALTVRRAVLEARRADLEETAGSRFLAAHPRRAIGLLGGLVSAPPGLERALAAALGSLADAVVYGDEEAALVDARDGDGVVLVVARGEPAPPSLPDERRLLDGLSVDPRVRGLAGLLFRDVYLAADVEEAAAKHRRHRRASFVTPEGLLVGPAVIRTAPRVDARAAALDRELREVDGELAGVRSALRASLLGALSSLGRQEEDLAERLARLDEAAAWREALAAPGPPPGGARPLPPHPDPPVAERAAALALRLDRTRLEAALADLERERRSLEEDPIALRGGLEVAGEARAGAEARLRAAEEAVAVEAARRRAAAEADREAAVREAEANRAWREAASELDRLRDAYEREDRERGDLERRIAEAERLLREGHHRDPAEALAALTEEDTPQSVERRSEVVARRLALLGKVNLLATGEYRTLQERHDFLARELDDVRRARRDLLEVIRQVDQEITARFESAFRDIAAEFEALFRELFPGGEGRLALTDPADILNTGVEIEARPGKKRVRRISLLSGGERALTALAFLFAIFRARPSPFYLLDEVEAALDDVNLHRFLALIRGFAERSQVILVTHQKRTMEAADVLYGVSIGRDGASTVVCQRLEPVEVPEAREVRGVPAREGAR